MKKKWTNTSVIVDCLIFPATPEKKTQGIRPVAKAQVLISVEQKKLFQEKAEQKKLEEERVCVCVCLCSSTCWFLPVARHL